MKILFMGKYDFSSLKGGIERYVYILRKYLPKRFTTLNLVSNTKNVTEYSGGVVKVASFGTLASTSLTPSMPIVLRTLLKKERPDIVHLQFPDPMAHLAYSLCGKKKSKLVISWHSDIVKQKRLFYFYKVFLNSILKKADAVIVHSEALKFSSQLKVVDQNKIHVIPIGVETLKINDHNLRRSMPKGFILFSFGRHVGYKGFDYLIKAVSLLPEDCYLFLAGSGPDTDKLEELVLNLNLQNRVFILGHVSDEILGSYINACDVFCFPSISQNEAFGISQVEAMQLGKPVVGFELHNGTTEVNLNDITGMVVENKNIAAFARAILTLKSDKNYLAKLGAQAKLRSCTIFSVRKMIAATSAVYESLFS